MKSIKLASGFAVSALALAIAGQATAQESTAEVDFTGSVKVQGVMDLENETRYNTLPGGIPDSDFDATTGEGGGDEDWFHLEAAWTISNGPFSGKLLVGIEADDDASGATANVRVEDLIVEEGPISFGQLGSVADTAGILEDLTDQDLTEDTTLDFDVDGAARYTVADLGLKVQAEGANRTVGTDGGDGGSDSNFGIAAGIEQDLDVATVWADFQYREVVNAAGDGMDDGETAFGVAAEVTPVDMVTLTAVFRSKSDETEAFGVRADVDATDELSVYAQLVDTDLDADDNMVMKVGGVATFAPITVEGSYEAGLSEDGQFGGFDAGRVFGKVTYTEGAITAFGETEVALNGDADAGAKFVLGGMYTTDSGIEYGAEYENQAVEFDGSEVSEVRAFAQYSF